MQEIIEYATAAKARDGLVRLHRNPDVALVELLDGNRTLRVTWINAPIDTEAPSPVSEVVSSPEPEVVLPPVNLDSAGPAVAESVTEPDIDSLDLDELKALAEAEGLDVTIRANTPIEKARERVAEALAAEEII